VAVDVPLFTDLRPHLSKILKPTIADTMVTDQTGIIVAKLHITNLRLRRRKLRRKAGPR
jgi:hypothetical protein